MPQRVACRDRIARPSRLSLDAFADAGRALEVVALKRELPSRLADLVAARAGRCLAILNP